MAALQPTPRLNSPRSFSSRVLPNLQSASSPVSASSSAFIKTGRRLPLRRSEAIPTPSNRRGFRALRLFNHLRTLFYHELRASNVFNHLRTLCIVESLLTLVESVITALFPKNLGGVYPQRYSRRLSLPRPPPRPQRLGVILSTCEGPSDFTALQYGVIACNTVQKASVSVLDGASSCRLAARLRGFGDLDAAVGVRELELAAARANRSGQGIATYGAGRGERQIGGEGAERRVRSPVG